MRGVGCVAPRRSCRTLDLFSAVRPGRAEGVRGGAPVTAEDPRNRVTAEESVVRDVSKILVGWGRELFNTPGRLRPRRLSGEYR